MKPGRALPGPLRGGATTDKAPSGAGPGCYLVVRVATRMRSSHDCSSRTAPAFGRRLSLVSSQMAARPRASRPSKGSRAALVASFGSLFRTSERRRLNVAETLQLDLKISRAECRSVQSACAHAPIAMLSCGRAPGPGVVARRWEIRAEEMAVNLSTRADEGCCIEAGGARGVRFSFRAFARERPPHRLCMDSAGSDERRTPIDAMTHFG